MLSNRLLLLALFLAFWCGAVTADAQRDPPDDNPKDNTLVEVGPERVAIFPRSESPDGRYAFAWTIRPRANRPPPDWSSYKPSAAYDWINQYPTPCKDSPGGYSVINGLVDLRTRQFTPLDTTAPVAPNNLYTELQVVWFKDGQDFRSALVNARAEGSALWRSTGLWLIETGAQGTQVVDLTTGANQAATDFLQRVAPERAKEYWLDYELGDVKKPRAAKGNAPKTWTIKLPFDADLPSGDGKVYAGTMAIDMPTGKITGLTAR